MLLVYVILFLGVLTSPFWLWQIKQPNQLNMLIVDKTVPDTTYREHEGLVWLLNNEKYQKPDKSFYVPSEDYVGFKPGRGQKYEITKLPDDLSNYEVIYLTDQYGVYEQEYYGNNPRGIRSDLIYGGLQQEDIRQLRSHLLNHSGTLVTEFNTFASPTSESIRQEMYDLLNVTWSGWIGRYFIDLADEEVPLWVIENYEKQTNEKWAFKGEGIVYANEQDKIVVLDKNDISNHGVTFSYTQAGEAFFDLDDSLQYQYWFDVITTSDEANILATYTVPVTNSGKEILKKHNLPETFPAVVKYSNRKYTSYYFAGDYADQEVPSIYQTVFYTWLKKQVTFDQPGRVSGFYWKIYLPMMKKLLEDGLHEMQEVTSLVETETKNDMTYNGKVHGDSLQILKDGNWTDFQIKGINMGMGKPGVFPGEAAITKQEYLRWFQQIGEMNANLIRVYTIHPPEFYEALLEHNLLAEKPLYVFHGVWLLEEEFVTIQDAYSEEVRGPFMEEIQRTIDLIHGNATIPKKRGHSSGKYTADVSPYILGWMLGIEWDAESVVQTNEKNKGKSQLSGKYFKTDNASPFELFLAEMMEYTAQYEAENYQQQRMMSFTNWPTTDLLTHPFEPYEQEDLVEVNPNHIRSTEDFYPGVFASYHVYPYYPDFMNYEPRYQNYKDHRGNDNNYAAYLKDLKEAHEMPIVVAEFGIPASRGITHYNVHGKHQGGHDEQTQGQMLSELYEDIIAEGYAGGIVFTWQDEWFKRTWNTMEHDNPDRRPYWSNIQTNEQFFGVLSFDPGQKGKAFSIDGKTDDWKANGVVPLAEDTTKNLQSISVSNDVESLYIKLNYKDLSSDAIHTSIMFDTIPDQGIQQLPMKLKDINTVPFDFYLQLTSKDQAELFVDSYYDQHNFVYAHKLKMIEDKGYANKKDNGVFHPIRLVLNRSSQIELEDGTIKKYPFEEVTTGKLTHGNGNPDDKDYNSLADFKVDEESGVVEIRIPWALLNVRDPSLHEIMGDLWTSAGIQASKQTEGFSIFAMEHDAKGEVISTLPQVRDNTIKKEFLPLYKWDEWIEPQYHERLKESYYILKETFAK